MYSSVGDPLTLTPQEDNERVLFVTPAALIATHPPPSDPDMPNTNPLPSLILLPSLRQHHGSHQGRRIGVQRPREEGNEHAGEREGQDEVGERRSYWHQLADLEGRTVLSSTGWMQKKKRGSDDVLEEPCGAVTVCGAGVWCRV